MRLSHLSIHCVAGFSLALLSLGSLAGAQQGEETPSHAPPARSIFGGPDAVAAAALAIGAAAVIPLDRRIALASQLPVLQQNRTLHAGATIFREVGQPGSIMLAGASYIYGRAGRSPASAELGLRTLESIGAAEITGYLIKGVVGRSRPYVTSDTNSHEFHLGDGFRGGDHASFPSGHASTAFAAASAASQEISYLWPHASHLWTPLLYTTASLTGLARVYEDKHWASDVLAGAALGTIMSTIVVRYGRTHPRNAIDRTLLPVAAQQSRNAGSARLPLYGLTWHFTL
jgi:membrane-associated phospholipid phosphatase